MPLTMVFQEIPLVPMDSPLTMVFQKDFYSCYAKLSGSLGPMDGISWNSTRHQLPMRMPMTRYQLPMTFQKHPAWDSKPKWSVFHVVPIFTIGDPELSTLQNPWIVCFSCKKDGQASIHTCPIWTTWGAIVPKPIPLQHNTCNAILVIQHLL